jgi:hypothetical protein
LQKRAKDCRYKLIVGVLSRFLRSKYVLIELVFWNRTLVQRLKGFNERICYRTRYRFGNPDVHRDALCVVDRSCLKLFGGIKDGVEKQDNQAE